MFIPFKKVFPCLVFTINTIVLSQSLISPNNLTLSLNRISNDLELFIFGNQNIVNPNERAFKLSFNLDIIKNNGHSNIDNNGNLFVSGKGVHALSSRIEYRNKFLFIELEPYFINQKNSYLDSTITGSYQYLNNHDSFSGSGRDDGLKNSQIILHYLGIGIGYGYINHWWSPGFHSAISLSSNAPSQETYSIGTFKDIHIGNFSFSSKIIVMPYNSLKNYQLYFSGLRSSISYHSNPSISIGFNRTYLSGDLTQESGFNFINKNLEWGIIDAAKLVIEPLFGSSKKGLPYTQEGTPGFDPWDEVLSGYIKIFFPEDNLEVYAEIASDDNRGNLNDLRAHWDHSLGYMLGFRKLFQMNNIKFISGLEYLSTKESNTLNPKFYRGSPNISNFYSKEIYDYFTYNNRLMGAHSGSSSDDLIFMFGFGNDNNSLLINYNKERHGIKSRRPPELKTELFIQYKKILEGNNSIFIRYEYENIENFGFISSNKSISRFIWIGYSLSIK